MGVDVELLDAIFGAGSHGETPHDRARTSNQRFVRSQGQLAFDNKNATGLRISAWQALQAFGFDVLVEVLEYGTAILPARPDEPAVTIEGQRRRLGFSPEQLASAAQVEVSDVYDAENRSTRTDMTMLAKLAQALALDEMSLAFTPNAGADMNLAARLRQMGNSTPGLGFSAVVALDEAAWVVATHARLWRWLGDRPVLASEFEPSADYGGGGFPPWEVGYRLAWRSREILGLGQEPIDSLRELAGKRLGIPIIQMDLPAHIGGATVSIGGQRGIVANAVGANKNEWVRRFTLAHELGHFLWDPDQHLEQVRVDPYHELDVDSVGRDQATGQRRDPVEARANAFAIEFLAPSDGVRKLFNDSPSTSIGLRNVMDYFGISFAAARYHVRNAMYQPIPLDNVWVEDTGPTDEWKGRETNTLDYFRPEGVPSSRRGRFALEVVRAEEARLISQETAALYLKCTLQDYEVNRGHIRALLDEY